MPVQYQVIQIHGTLRKQKNMRTNDSKHQKTNYDFEGTRHHVVQTHIHSVHITHTQNIKSEVYTTWHKNNTYRK